MFDNASNSLISPNRWKYRYLQCFLQFFHVPMPVANSNIYIRNPSKTLFLTVFFQCFQSRFCYKGSKSFQNIAFDSVFVMLPVKHTVIYTFFAITSVQNTCFCSVFNALASKNPAKSCYVQCFFHFWPFFHCRKATKMTQNSISIPSCAQTPKNPRKMSKTHRILVSVRNRFWPPPYEGIIGSMWLFPFWLSFNGK